MHKKKSKHPVQDFHTGFLSKVFILLGIALIVSYLIISGLLPFVLHNESFLEAGEVAGWFSLSIIFIVIGVILYFIHLQLLKLDEITEELTSNYQDINHNER